SSWYDHVNVPTWNYIAVHVYGKVKILDNEGAVGVLQRLVKRYEKDSEKPFRMDTLDEKFMVSHLKALVAFEITIDKIDAKEKLSQNRDAHNYDLVLHQLHKRPDEQSKAIKKEMERVKRSLFKK
ncbi:MAG: FMN-binding negative transcriptional regulator, partial [Fimbriimonadaceae bacterium]|nr:FMN-binding negative transcriptional regulator [Chitinophagales bacterium]